MEVETDAPEAIFPEKSAPAQVIVTDLGILEADEKVLKILIPDKGASYEAANVITYPDGGLRAWGVVLGG
jgi:hypothetical protein